MAQEDAFERLSRIPRAYFAKMSEDVPAGDIDALRVFLALRAAARRVDNAVSTWLDRNHLTSTKLDVLHLLRSAGELSVTQMAEFLRMTQPNVTFVVNALERDALVARTVSAHDRRSSTIALSAQGEALVARVTPYHVHAITRALADLSAEQRTEFIRTLALLTDAFEATHIESN